MYKTMTKLRSKESQISTWQSLRELIFLIEATLSNKAISIHLSIKASQDYFQKEETSMKKLVESLGIAGKLDLLRLKNAS